MDDLTITYRDEPVGSREATTPSVDSLQDFATLGHILLTGNTAPQHATFEDDYWVLGTDYKLFPDSPGGLTWGLFSKQISGEDGTFGVPITLALVLSELFSSIGLTLCFDPYGPTWCCDLQIQWWRAGTVIRTKDFAPDAWQYVCYEEVRNFDMVTITFRKMSHGYRFLKLQSLTYGITRVFDSEECYSTDLYQDTDLLSDVVAVNTLDFVLRNKSAVDFLFQRRQILYAQYGKELLGVYYISTAEKVGGNRYDIHAVDLVGLAEMASDHPGGFYDGVRADALASEILGSDISWAMDDDLKGVLLYGHLPKASRRENLRQLAFALCAIVLTGHRTNIQISRMSRTKLLGSFDNPKGYENGSISTGTLVTSVSVTAHSYIKSDDPTTLYEDELTGDEMLEFSDPVCDLAITGGQIVASNANYAVIRGTGSKVILTGYQYKHIKRVYSKANPLKNANDADNPVSYQDMTLVSPHNVQDVLAACYAYNLRLDTVKGKVLTTTERPGDYVEILTDSDGVKKGHLLSLDYVPSTKLAADAVILADYEGDDAG